MADQRTKVARLRAKLEQKPRNVRFGELERLMDLAGFEVRFTRSKHGFLFWHRVYPVSAHGAYPKSGPVLKTYVEGCFDAIDEVAQLEENSNA